MSFQFLSYSHRQSHVVSGRWRGEALLASVLGCVAFCHLPAGPLQRIFLCGSIIWVQAGNRTWFNVLRSIIFTTWNRVFFFICNPQVAVVLSADIDFEVSSCTDLLMWADHTCTWTCCCFLYVTESHCPSAGGHWQSRTAVSQSSESIHTGENEATLSETHLLLELV